ncbi:MAG TPA: polyphosphate polymerase domain-containing protein [Vicinamibacterales bacterium]|nr:polyphosphate polymerase domain-containing protein [Vicinamibacterales bacterium]
MSPHARETRPFASEVKFVLPAALGNALRGWARENLEPDPYGGGQFNDWYHTASLYFDTPEGHVFHRRGSFGRSKYRVRRYGDAEFVFLERKLRKPGVLVKRRTIVPLDSLGQLYEPITDREWPGEWFHRRLMLRQIRPVCEVSYARVARFARTPEGPARLTLDDDVRVVPVHATRFSGQIGTAVIPGQVILELKYRYRAPAIFRRLVEEFALEPQRASKYRFGMTTLGEDAFAAVTAASTTHV